ncbi:hypothetical protein BG011_002568 [Mortierella polycephala]|uniref:Invertebrate defensins family profile domain-containing protein n=1 Tax=Mortierella polycephala TaxID=41804 RepID=A0A9P6PEK5_9FUNG|nr:hypothetical protein BG011_002568 [Mortierella polycephala]
MCSSHTAIATTSPARAQVKVSKFTKLALLVVVLAVLMTPVSAGYGCPGNDYECSDYCRSIGRNGGHCGGFLWLTCQCNK